MDRRPRIFLVEDEEFVAETIVSALGEDYQVTAFGEAAQAIDKFASETPDLVLLDLLLPGGGAADVIALADVHGVPLILMTGDIERAETLRDGPRTVLAKPFSIDAMLEALSKALAR